MNIRQDGQFDTSVCVCLKTRQPRYRVYVSLTARRHKRDSMFMLCLREGLLVRSWVCVRPGSTGVLEGGKHSNEINSTLS